LKKISLLTGILALSLVFTACSNGEDGGKISKKKEVTKEAKKEITFNLNRKITSLNPVDAQDVHMISLFQSTHEGLTRVGKNGETIMAGAKSFDISDDGLVYTFHLRDNHWSNGDKVTAYDYEFSWKYVLDPQNESNTSYLLYPVKNAEKVNMGKMKPSSLGVKALDDVTFEVTLEKPTPYFLEITSAVVSFPLNKKIVENDKEWYKDVEKNISSGPFAFGNLDASNKLTFVKNNHYWDAENVKLEKVNFLFVMDDPQIAKKYEKGEIDWIGYPFSEVSSVIVEKKPKDAKLNKFVSPSSFILRFNVDEKPFNNKKIRQALAYSLDRKTLTKDVSGLAHTPATTFVPPSVFENNKDGLFKDFQVDEAKKLLEEGMKEEGITEFPTFEILSNDSESVIAILDGVKLLWKENLGIDVTIKTLPWDEFSKLTEQKKFTVSTSGWAADYHDATAFLNVLALKDGYFKTGWYNETYNELLNEASVEKNEIKRNELMAEAEKILISDMPIVPIYYYTDYYLQNEDVQGMYLDPLGNLDFRHAYFK